MKILKMTATFGKLENETLTLKPGLDIIEAPNEWGKSTWCAFLTAMLYGIDTKKQTTKDHFAVKEHYAPWSGLPMSGTMEIEWENRKITIQRTSQARIPLGVFSAYETETGLPVSELTAATCGKTLLGVERSVFERTAFLRLTDLPISDDGALRDRLNALVTTGDESGADTMLTEKLQKLNNACKHNKTGKLPEAEREKEEILLKLRKIDALQSQQEEQQKMIKDLEEDLSQLKNHKTHLLYQGAKEEETHLHNAAAQTEQLRQAVGELEEECASLPPEEETRYKLRTLSSLQHKWAEMQEKPQPQAPVAPTPLPVFAGLSGEEAVRRVRQDQEALARLQKSVTPLYLIGAIFVFVLSIVMSFLVNPAIGASLISVGAAFLVLNSRAKRTQEEKVKALCEPYGDIPPLDWIVEAEHHRLQQQTFEQETQRYKADILALEKEKVQLTTQLNQLTLGNPNAMDIWKQQLDLREVLIQKKAALSQAENHENALRAVIKPLPAPETEDSLTLTLPETEAALARTEASLSYSTNQLQQLVGQASSAGDKDALLRALNTIDQRICQLLDYKKALEIALETAVTASQSLQRRFAPAISKRAQALFSRLTGGRYDRLVLNQDFSMMVAAETETVPQITRFHSDGTVDQLYLALRLAVSEVVAPDAPLVLDDALVRFDDTRLAEALSLLKEESATKQVILFTCQSREQKIMGN